MPPSGFPAGYPEPQSGGGVPDWVWAVVVLVVAVPVVALLAVTLLGRSSSETFSAVDTGIGAPTPVDRSGGGSPQGYGDDPELDALHDGCEDGDGRSCDILYSAAPVDTDYELYGLTCGHRFDESDTPEACEDVELGGEAGTPATTAAPVEIEGYGDDADLDRLWDICESGDGQACDDLYWQSPSGSEYQLFGRTCGERYPMTSLPLDCRNEPLDGTAVEPGPGPSGGFTSPPGTDPDLDALWAQCAGGDGLACDDLFWDSPIGSLYEDFGGRCGNRYPSIESAPFSCVGEM